MPDGYLRPAHTYHTETQVLHSRFVATIALADTVDAAKAVLESIRHEMPDASHHVYAFAVGHGKSVIEGASDAGEPSGTAGLPVLAALRGSDLGDTILVVTRYFGGIKLGTGGLVRAYSDAAKAAIAGVQTEANILRARLVFHAPYPLYERIVRLVREQGGEIAQEVFTQDVALEVILEASKVNTFLTQLRDLSAGRITPLRREL